MNGSGPTLRVGKRSGSNGDGGRHVIRIGGREIGGDEPFLIAGPCAVESREQMLEVAFAVKEAGAHMLRGGAFKPRTSPYSFQGLGEKGLEILAEAREATGLPFVTEVMDPRLMDLVASYADVIQIGSRNMANYPLLVEAGRAGKPVLLKRGWSATLEEWVYAAEYVALEGNMDVILCERGLRTFTRDEYTRNTIDIGVVPALREITCLPVIVDPSHAAGRADLVPPLAKAALAVGADGLIIEVIAEGTDRSQVRCDGDQSIRPGALAEIAEAARLASGRKPRRLVRAARGPSRSGARRPR